MIEYLLILFRDVVIMQTKQQSADDLKNSSRPVFAKFQEEVKW